MEKATSAVIVNLTEQHWILHRSYGTYRVRGCEDGEAYALTRVDRRKAVMDHPGDGFGLVHATEPLVTDLSASAATQAWSSGLVHRPVTDAQRAIPMP